MTKFVVFLTFLFVAGVFCRSTSNEEEDVYRSPINDRDPVPKSPNFPCLRGWLYIANQGVCLLPTPETTWPAAEQFCQKLGGHLMPIHGRYSFDNIKQVLGDNVNVWTGLNKDDEHDTWKHADGEIPNYLTWSAQNPATKCARALGTQIFYDWSCDTLFFGICQVYASV